MSNPSAMDTSSMPRRSKSVMVWAASATDRNRRSNRATTTTGLVRLASARSRLPAGRVCRGLPPDTPASSNTAPSRRPLGFAVGADALALDFEA